MRLKGCGLQVLVGGKALREYTHGGLTVVEARLDLPETREVIEHCETPHGIEEDAHWRVTPYELLLTNDNDFDVAATTRLGNTLFEKKVGESYEAVCYDFHEKVAELCINYKLPAEIQDLGIDRESSGADLSVLPELLMSSVKSLLESVRTVYGVDLFDHASEIGAKALANDCKLLPRTPLSGPQGATAAGLLRGLSRALAAALLLSDRLHFVVEALWNPGQQQQQCDAEAVPQRLQAVARSFGVRLSLVEGRSRWEYAPYAVTAKTRDVAVGWAGDRYVALVGSMAVPLIRSNKRSDPDPAPQSTA
eukprot:m51a1_g13469 hypothetical protein (307) ;mRNA; f:123-1553